MTGLAAGRNLYSFEYLCNHKPGLRAQPRVLSPRSPRPSALLHHVLLQPTPPPAQREDKNVPVGMHDGGLGLAGDGRKAEAEAEPAEGEEEEHERDALPRRRRGRVEARVLREPAVQLVHVARRRVLREPPLLVARRQAVVAVVGHRGRRLGARAERYGGESGRERGRMGVGRENGLRGEGADGGGDGQVLDCVRSAAGISPRLSAHPALTTAFPAAPNKLSTPRYVYENSAL